MCNCETNKGEKTLIIYDNKEEKKEETLNAHDGETANAYVGETLNARDGYISVYE